MSLTIQSFQKMCESLYPFDVLEPLNNREKIIKLLNAESAIHFTPLALHGSQNVIAIWKTPDGGEPIVWLDSEGSNWVIAENIESFMAMLPYSPNIIYDFCSAWEYYDPEERYQKENYDGILSDAREEYSRYNELIDWLKAQSIEIDFNPIVTIGKAMKKYSDFSQWIKTFI